MIPAAGDLAERLNLESTSRGWRGACPACGYLDVLSLRAGRQGGSPSLRCFNGCTREDVEAELQRRLGGGWKPPSPDPTPAARARRDHGPAVDRLWRGSDPAPGTPVATYAAARGIPTLASSAAIRFRADASHPEVSGPHPAMVAAVHDRDGHHVACHRTYLRPDGSGKASLTPPRASLGPVWGGAVRLDPIAAELVIGEGIETAASAGLLLGLPAWSALSAGNLSRGLMLPSEVRSVIVAADHDEPGAKAAAEAAARWRSEGRRVRIAKPDRAGADFNDVVRERGHG